jgi:hypothetical protein
MLRGIADYEREMAPKPAPVEPAKPSKPAKGKGKGKPAK